MSDMKMVHLHIAINTEEGDLKSIYLKKKNKAGKIGANDSCPCGSGKKYKKCCKGKPIGERPSSDVLSIP